MSWTNLNRNKTCLLSLVFSLLFVATTWAESSRTIVLKDGSHIKGNILSLSDHIYMIETLTMGKIEVHEENILSILSSESGIEAPSGNGQGQNFQAQMGQMQQNILQNPEMMTAIMGLAQDPEIMAILNDPQLLNDIMNSNVQGLENNPKVQELMNHPKMQGVIDKATQQKIIPPQPTTVPSDL